MCFSFSFSFLFILREGGGGGFKMVGSVFLFEGFVVCGF